MMCVRRGYDQMMRCMSGCMNVIDPTIAQDNGYPYPGREDHGVSERKQ